LIFSNILEMSFFSIVRIVNILFFFLKKKICIFDKYNFKHFVFALILLSMKKVFQKNYSWYFRTSWFCWKHNSYVRKDGHQAQYQRYLSINNPIRIIVIINSVNEYVVINDDAILLNQVLNVIHIIPIDNKYCIFQHYHAKAS